MLCVIGGVAAVPYFYRRVDEGIRCKIETLFTKHYAGAGLKTTVGSAELVAGQGIRIRKLIIEEPGAGGPRAELANIEEIFIDCQTDVKELILRDPVVNHVTVRRPTIRVTRRPDGTWSAGKLFPLPRFGNQSPEVTIENGTIEVFDPLKSPASTLTLRDLNMTVSPATLVSTDPAAVPQRNIQGMFTGENFRRVEFRGAIDAVGSAYKFTGEVDSLQIAPELIESMPGPIADKFAELRDLRAEGSLSFGIAYNPNTDAAMQFQVAGQLVRGRFAHKRLPNPLTDMKIWFRANNGGVVIDKLTAMYNQTTLSMSYTPTLIKAELRKLQLDRQLLDILPDNLQELWRKYLPIGVVDGDITLQYDGKNWQPTEVSTQCLNVSFLYSKFPYRVERGKGWLELKNNLLKMNMTAYCGEQPVRLTAEVTNPLSVEPAFTFDVTGNDIQIDPGMIRALPDKSRDVVESLHPTGVFNVEYRCWRNVPQQEMQQHLTLTSNSCSICYDKFPYPINNIRGRLEMVNHFWTFKYLEGMNNNARISGEGDLTPLFPGNRFVLNLTANDVPLDSELCKALTPNIQQVWHDLRPRGFVDLKTQITYLSEQKQLNIGVRAEPKGETTSIEPVHFPYRMEKLKGVLFYQDGRVTLQQCKAEHGDVKISTEGLWDFLPDGGWTMHFANLRAESLRQDRDLLFALPERLKKAVIVLNPIGPITMHGNLDLTHSGRQGDPIQSKWEDMQFEMAQGSMQCGVKLENIWGSVTFNGRCEDQKLFCRGKLNIDSLNYKEYPFTNITGPIWIDDQKVLLGGLVDKAPDGRPLQNADGTTRAPRSISAGLFDGTIFADGWLALGSEPRYGLSATLSHADLSKIAQVVDSKQHLKGKIMADIRLQGSGMSRNAITGSGKIELTEADVYELPVMISMLKILSIRAPDRNAFSKSLIDYRIEGEHIYFDSIDFIGDAISLRGQGDMDFQSNINMNFTTTIGTGEWDLPVIRQIYRGASRQFLQIYVNGTLQDPKIRREALPGINQALQPLQGARQ